MSEVTHQQQDQQKDQEQSKPEETRLKNDEFENWLRASDEGNFIKMNDGEKRILTFDIKQVKKFESKFKDGNGNPIIKYTWTVITPQGQTKTINLSKTASRDLYNMLTRGVRTVEVERQGSSTDTKYIFFPIR